MKKILLVDDHKPMHTGMECLFFDEIDSEVLEFYSALNGQEALEKIQATVFDLILLDQQMPVMDGLTFLKEKAKKCIHVPVIMMSGILDNELKSRAFEMGVLAFFEKPIQDIHKFRKDVFSVISLKPEIQSVEKKG